MTKKDLLILLIFFTSIPTYGRPIKRDDQKKEIIRNNMPNHIGVKTNLLYSALTLTPNIALEIGVGKRTSIEIAGSYNPWNLKGKAGDNKKKVHYLIKPAFRYWLAERFNGHFVGAHLLFAQYNIGGYSLPMLFGKQSKMFRHQGSAYGMGLAYGYLLKINKRWAAEFNIGAGYLQMRYDKYDCESCGKLYENGKTKNYFGPTEAGIKMVFLINK